VFDVDGGAGPDKFAVENFKVDFTLHLRQSCALFSSMYDIYNRLLLELGKEPWKRLHSWTFPSLVLVMNVFPRVVLRCTADRQIFLVGRWTVFALPERDSLSAATAGHQ
jgi:hypothetical protein